VYAGIVKAADSPTRGGEGGKGEMTVILPRQLLVTQNKPLSWPLSAFGVAARDVFRCATNTTWWTANYSFVGTDNM
jgi:hypothetical protein